MTAFVCLNDMVKALLDEYPGWPQPFSTPSPPTHKDVPIKGKGRGLVATKDIAAGETIVRERPFLVLPMFVREHPVPVEALEGAMHPENILGTYALKKTLGRILIRCT